MAEHMVCNHGVRGSNPLTSTKALPIGNCQLPIVTAKRIAVSTLEAVKVERSIPSELSVEVSALRRKKFLVFENRIVTVVRLHS